MGSIVSSDTNKPQSQDSENTSSTHGKVHVIQNRQEWEAKLLEGTTSGKVVYAPGFIQVVVDFTATWCGPCKFIAPFFAELSEKYPNLIYLKVDVDDHTDISQEWDIRAMPTFLFIIDSKNSEKIVGANKGELEKKVKLYSEKCAARAA